MSDAARDHPNVIAFPPLILASALAVSWGLGVLLPLSLLPPAFSGIALVFGLADCALAAFIAISAILAFKRAGTHVEPHKPALVLVEDGPYRFTRNPMYLGLLLLHLGVSFIFSLDWGLFVLPVLWVTLHRGVVLREEAYLTAKFGTPYVEFLSRTRRWI
ncbi:MAG: isoprenylcysteine carboxylmethyltransferase family protein [Pseudomonadota bacterium]